MRNNWIYVASDVRACIRDTRRLALDGLVWHALPPVLGVQAEDRLLMVFRKDEAMYVLGIFGIALAAGRNGFDRVVVDAPVYVEELWPVTWDHFRRATRGIDGLGYGDNARRRALCVSTIDAFDDLWLGITEPHAAPLAASITFPAGVLSGETLSLLPPKDELNLNGDVGRRVFGHLF